MDALVTNLFHDGKIYSFGTNGFVPTPTIKLRFSLRTNIANYSWDIKSVPTLILGLRPTDTDIND